jgi:glycerol-3-phosphate O-acyltransferase/dihydroxyacetone phosphate acyltransferase
MSSLIYSGLQIFLQQATGTYFHNIHVAGLENMPMEGPTILCCNHANQFMDAFLIIAQCPRPLSFCFAASSYNKPIVGYLAKKINVIPVYRAEDSKVNGTGKIIMTSDTDVQGFNTKFISDLKNNKNFKLGIHSLLIQKKYKLMVEKVIDEDHIKVKSAPDTYEMLKKKGRLNFAFIPRLDNSIMFKETCQKLKEEKAICIFPEGTSHDRTHLLQLKPGVAYIALEAMANYGVKNIKIISCGLSYFNRDEFRSDLVLEFGIPYVIPESLGNLFKENKKHAVDIVLKIVETQMRLVILTAPTYKEYMLIKMLRNLYVPNDYVLPPEKSTELARRIKYIYNSVRDNKKAELIRMNVLKYIVPLEKLGLDDSDLKEMNLNYRLLIKKFMYSLCIFFINLLLAFPMLAISYPLVKFVRNKVEAERCKSLEKNPNKIQAKDVVSSVKIVTFFKYLPCVGILWIYFFHILLNVLLKKITHREYDFLYVFFLGSITFMLYGYISVYIIDILKCHFETLKTIFYFFVVPKGIDNLKDMRKKLVIDVNDFINESIKDTQYENDRIIAPKRES